MEYACIKLQFNFFFSHNLISPFNKHHPPFLSLPPVISVYV